MNGFGLTRPEKGLRPTHLLTFHDLGEHPASIERAMADARYHAAVPVLTLQPQTPHGRSALAGVIRGGYRDWLREVGEMVARQAHAGGARAVVRFGHEMNGVGYYPWQGDPVAYVEAFRVVAGAMPEAGHLWCPNVPTDDPRELPMEEYWPGSGAASAVGVDGYCWGANWPERGGFRPMRDVLGPGLERVSRVAELAGGLPVWVGETACSEVGGSKARWIKDGFRWLEESTDVDVLLWFNENKEEDWRAASSPSAKRALVKATKGVA